MRLRTLREVLRVGTQFLKTSGTDSHPKCAEMRPIPLLVLLTLSVAGASGRQKTDIATLANGNEVTCEVLSLNRGVLKAKTDSLSTVSIRWEDVKRIRSSFIFEIILSGSSAPLFGELTPDAAGDLVLAKNAVASTSPTPLYRVVPSEDG